MVAIGKTLVKCSRSTGFRGVKLKSNHIVLHPHSSQEDMLFRAISALVLPYLIQYSLQVDALRSLNWESKRSIPYQLCQWPETSADAKRCGVI